MPGRNGGDLGSRHVFQRCTGIDGQYQQRYKKSKDDEEDHIWDEIARRSIKLKGGVRVIGLKFL